MNTLKRLRPGQRVRIADPVHIAARFWSQEHGGIVGAGYGYVQIVPRGSLDTAGAVVAISGKGKTGTRGLVEFDGSGSMWLDADQLVPATVKVYG